MLGGVVASLCTETAFARNTSRGDASSIPMCLCLINDESCVIISANKNVLPWATRRAPPAKYNMLGQLQRSTVQRNNNGEIFKYSAAVEWLRS